MQGWFVSMHLEGMTWLHKGRVNWSNDISRLTIDQNAVPLIILTSAWGPRWNQVSDILQVDTRPFPVIDRQWSWIRSMPFIPYMLNRSCLFTSVFLLLNNHPEFIALHLYKGMKLNEADFKSPFELPSNFCSSYPLLHVRGFLQFHLTCTLPGTGHMTSSVDCGSTQQTH